MYATVNVPLSEEPLNGFSVFAHMTHYDMAPTAATKTWRET